MTTQEITTLVVSIGTMTMTIAFLRTTIALAMKDLKADIQKLFKITTKNSNVTGKFIENDAFYTELEDIAGTVCEVNKDEKVKLYANTLAKNLIEFSKEIFMITPEKITDTQVDTKSNYYIQQCGSLFAKYWGDDHLKKYLALYSGDRCDYAEEVKRISSTPLNSKEKGFRIMTLAFMRKLLTNFVEYYDDYLRKRED